MPPPPDSPILNPPLLVQPKAGERFLMGSLKSFFMVDPAQVGGAFEMHEQDVPAGVLIVPHVHDSQDQVSYVAEGTLGLLVGDTEYVAPAGSCIARPRGVVHALWNRGPGAARMLEISSPGSEIAEFFRGFDRLSASGGVTAESVSELAAPYGIHYRPDLTGRLESAHQVSAAGAWWPQ